MVAAPVVTQLNLAGQDRVEVAIERLRMMEPPEGYYLAYSGGKDSTALLALARLAGVRFDAHYQLTTVDPPELVRFIRQQEGVAIERPRYTMWQLIVAHRTPPTRRIRYCCAELKERGGEERVVLTGVRWAESSRRKTRQWTEQCYRNGRHMIHPIIDWPDSAVWGFIHAHKLPYCLLYDEGFDRLGCVLCPMAGREKRERQARRWPKLYASYLRAFGRMLEEKRRIGKPSADWHTPEDVMRWWLEQPDEQPIDTLPLFGGEG